MKYSEALAILSESKLSPEQLAPLIGISNMTYRRWLQRGDKNAELSTLHERGVKEAIRILRLQKILPIECSSDGRLDQSAVLESVSHTIDAFQSYRSTSNTSEEVFLKNLLHRIGSSSHAQAVIDASKHIFEALHERNPKMSADLRFLLEASSKKGVPQILKTIACGALLYFITPVDMIPDFNIGVGYLDDYGVIAFAAAFCQTKNCAKKIRSAKS